MTDPGVPDRNRYLKTDHLANDLKGRSVRGGFVTGLSQGLKLFIQIGSTALLARILTPADYGLVAMTAVMVGLLGLFKDAGLTSATIQRQQLDHEQVSSLFWINLGVGIVLALLLLLLSPAIAMFYNEPRVAAIAVALAITFVFGGLSVQHQALLRRQMRFRALAVVEVTSILAGVAIGIAMAVHGFGYWSLVGITVGTAFISMFGAWVAVPWVPGAPKSSRGLGELVRFGTDVLRFNLVNFFSRQADTILIGRFWGETSLGLYDKAYSLLMLPIRQMNAPLAAIAVPALSRSAADTAQFRRYFLRGLELVTSVTVPVIVVIALFADEVVLLWLGSDWMESARLFRLLAPAALIGAISNPVGWILIACGKTRRLRRVGIATAIVIVSSFVIGLPFGAAGVAIAYSIAMALLFVPLWWFVTLRTPVPFSGVMISQLPPAVSALVAAGLTILLKLWAVNALSPAVGSALCIAAFVAVYGGILLVAFGRWRLFLSVASTLRPARSP